jgi:hypothetical protein
VKRGKYVSQRLWTTQSGRKNASEKLWINSKARASSSCGKNATEPVSRSFRSATLYQKRSDSDPTPGIVDVNVTQSETKYGLKAVISAEGAKFNTSPGRNVRPENQRPCQSQVHNREECRPFGNDKVVYIGEVQGTITMFGTVVRIELSRIAWVGGWRRTSISKMQLAYCMTVHKAQGLNSPTLCRRSQHTDHGQRT